MACAGGAAVGAVSLQYQQFPGKLIRCSFFNKNLRGEWIP
jgi:hypothetical protein